MAFHVPELARLLDGPMASAPHAGPFGAFEFDSPEPGWQLAMIADDGTDTTVPGAAGWEHVSVRATRGRHERTPTWKEMAFVKAVYWDAAYVVVQYHPRRSEYVNAHPHVLHLWRARDVTFPTPPASLVGPVADDGARPAATAAVVVTS